MKTIERLTIEEAKNKAAQEFEYDGWARLTLESDMDTFVKYHDRAMQIYADSCVSDFKEEVREKLPGLNPIQAQSEIAFTVPDNQICFIGGAVWFRGEVKELLK